MKRTILLSISAFAILGAVFVSRGLPAHAQANSGGPGITSFTNPSASWLWSPPTGAYTDISSEVSGFNVYVYSGQNNPNYYYPVQYTDGSMGTTTFNDYGYYGRRDDIAVPNVQANACGWTPSTGSDGHLIVVDTSNRMAYDFWKLCVNSSGCATTCPGNSSPTSIGEIKSYSLNLSNGAGGDTASGITGLAGDILPGELATGAAVPHALSVVCPASMMRNTICDAVPATNTDGQNSGALFCEGAKLAMDPSIDVDSLSASNAAKAIMKAMQIYGAAITDQTGASNDLIFYSALPTDADLTGINQMLPYLRIYYSH